MKEGLHKIRVSAEVLMSAFGLKSGLSVLDVPQGYSWEWAGDLKHCDNGDMEIPVRVTATPGSPASAVRL